MHDISLTKRQQRELQEQLKKTKNTKVLRRLQCILFAHEEEPRQRIASLLGITSSTVSVWTKLFLKEGFEGLCTLHYDGRRPSQLDKYKKEIKEYIKKNNPSQLQELQQHIKDTWNITVEFSWLWRYCKKNSVFPERRLG